MICKGMIAFYEYCINNILRYGFTGALKPRGHRGLTGLICMAKSYFFIEKL